jgi:hypothetical protein
MKPDLLKVIHDGDTVLTVDNEIVADKIVKQLLKGDCEIKPVRLTSDSGTRNAKQFLIKDLMGITIPWMGICVLFHKGTIVNVYTS